MKTIFDLANLWVYFGKKRCQVVDPQNIQFEVVDKLDSDNHNRSPSVSSRQYSLFIDTLECRHHSLFLDSTDCPSFSVLILTCTEIFRTL
jgi:hypothetical protein